MQITPEQFVEIVESEAEKLEMWGAPFQDLPKRWSNEKGICTAQLYNQSLVDLCLRVTAALVEHEEKQRPN